jgi:hypothetical protein
VYIIFVLKDCDSNLSKAGHFSNHDFLVHLPNSYFEPGSGMDIHATSERINHFQSDTKRGVLKAADLALYMYKTVHLSLVKHPTKPTKY